MKKLCSNCRNDLEMKKDLKKNNIITFIFFITCLVTHTLIWSFVENITSFKEIIRILIFSVIFYIIIFGIIGFIAGLTVIIFKKFNKN